MSSNYDQLVASATAVIECHNLAIGDGGQVSVEDFRTGLKVMGGTTIDALKQVLAADIEDLGVPKLVARQIAALFRAGGELEAESERPRTLSEARAANATMAELVLAYDPQRPNSPAARELKQRTQNRPFVVFDENGGVHRKATTQLAEELERGEAGRSEYVLSGRPQRLYSIGERPPESFDEHPLFRGVALRRDGSCGRGLNWLEGIGKEVRLLLRFAVESGELQVSASDVDKLHQVHELAVAEDAASKLRLRYQQASLKYDDLERAGSLPTLKVVGLGGSQAPSGGDPFHGGSRHVRT